MFTSHQISNGLCLTIAFFNAVCVQAHMTDKLTPAISKDLREKLPWFNKHVFAFLGISENALKSIFISSNILLAVTLFSETFRGLGLKLCFGFLGIAFYSDIILGESLMPHFVLLVLAGSALALR